MSQPREPVSLLRLLPELGATIDEDERDEAGRVCAAHIVTLAHGPVDPASVFGEPIGAVGALLLSGVVWREVALLDHALIELLGPGDVLQAPAVGAPRHPRTKLVASRGAMLAVLGAPFLRAAARWPGLLVTLGERLERQRERLAIQALTGHQTRAELRLLTTLWHLAERFGERTGQGTALRLPLTHELLGRLIAARRPTVTIAARALEAEGLVHRLHDGAWLLTPRADEVVSDLMGVVADADQHSENFMLRLPASMTVRETAAFHAHA